MAVRNLATSYEPALVLVEEPRAEIAGTDDMYIPTTQVRITPGGEWHRRSSIATETACGETYAACLSREYELGTCLCTKCFTPRELELARAALDAAFEKTLHEDD